MTQNSFTGSNPPKCIELSSGLPMHFKMNLEIYQTQKVINLIVVSFNVETPPKLWRTRDNGCLKLRKKYKYELKFIISFYWVHFVQLTINFISYSHFIIAFPNYYKIINTKRYINYYWNHFICFLNMTEAKIKDKNNLVNRK